MTRIVTRNSAPRTVWQLEQQGLHPLLARLYAARGVTDHAEDELLTGAEVVHHAGLGQAGLAGGRVVGDLGAALAVEQPQGGVEHGGALAGSHGDN